MKKIVTFTLLLCMVLALAACTPEQTPDPKEDKYAEAYELLEKRDYEAAYALFVELGDYKDAAKEAAYFRYIPTAHIIECVSDEEQDTINYTVTLNDQNLPIAVVEEYASGSKHTCNITRNELGDVTRRECSNTDGTTTLYVATYDANGNLLNEMITDIDGNTSEFNYIYNEKGQLFKVVTTNAPTYYLSCTYTYDDEGREFEILYVYEDGNITEKNTSDADGKLLKKTWIEEDDDVYSVNDYKYDEKGRLVEILFTEEGEYGGFRKVTYNDKDQLVTEHVYYTFGYEYKNNYEYDEHGNATKTTYTDVVDAYSEITESTYKLVYLPFEFNEKEWVDLCDSTHCWDVTHFQ